MKLIVTKRRKWLLLITGIGILTAIGFLATGYLRNYNYNTLKSFIIDGDQYLANATILEQYESGTWMDSDVDIHVLLPKEQAQRMVSENILKDCEPKRSGCPESAWRPHSSYNFTTIDGDTNVYHNELALPTAVLDSDTKDVVCTMYRRSSESAYGICVNPHTGHLWYHAYVY